MTVMMHEMAARMSYSHQHHFHQLPQQQQQQLWDWKVEPVSPPPLVDLDADNWFSTNPGDYMLAAGTGSELIVPDAIAEVDTKPPTRAETATRLLNDLDEWIKEDPESVPEKYEPFSDWYEEKIDLPIFEELETVQPPVVTRKNVEPAACSGGLIGGCTCDSRTGHVDVKMPFPQGHQPHTILSQAPPAVPVAMEHTTPALMQEFEFVLNSHETLTPPESPREDGIGLTMLQDMRTEELDELVRIRVESLVESPETSRCSSYQEECDANSPASLDSGYEDPDPDWTPEPNPEPKLNKRRRQMKPYSRPPPEEKRQRKKEQNKNAATRYRLKKKAEIEEILGEEKELQDKNQKLKTDLSELAREVKYLKNLMKEVFKAKGLIK